MLKFMILFYCKIIHIMQESHLGLITGYHQLKTKIDQPKKQSK